MKKILFLACLPVVALYSCCGNGDKTQETFGKVFKEVKAEYVEGLEFHYVKMIDEVLKLALK